MSDHDDEYTKILDMIEGVSPDDTDTLDEIDVRVFYYLNDRTFPLNDIKRDVRVAKKWSNTPEYTRSRDALKSIRPEGWYFQLVPCESEEWMCDAGYGVPFDEVHVEPLPTEELVELHTIIQAVQWDSKNK